MNMPDEKEYFPILLSTIRANTIQDFSIFIKLKDKFVLYHAGGENLTEVVLNKLIANKVWIIYIPSKETDVYNNYLVDNLTMILKDPKISIEEKSKITHSSVKTIAKQFFKKPSINTFSFFKSSVNKLTDLILLNDDALSNLIRLATKDHDTYIHSINVGLFGTGLAKFLFENDRRHNIQKISTGFFLHDVGKCSIPQNILNKKNPLNHNEWKIIKQHPAEGYKLLNQFNAITEEIKVITIQHHERSSGKGYPMGLKGDQIHIYSKMCSIADSFEALTSNRPYKKRAESSFNALFILKNEMLNEVDPFIFQQFVQLFSDSLKASPK